jgi:hypothetical protein
LAANPSYAYATLGRAPYAPSLTVAFMAFMPRLSSFFAHFSGEQVGMKLESRRARQPQSEGARHAMGNTRQPTASRRVARSRPPRAATNSTTTAYSSTTLSQPHPPAHHNRDHDVHADAGGRVRRVARGAAATAGACRHSTARQDTAAECRHRWEQRAGALCAATEGGATASPRWLCTWAAYAGF